MAKRPYQKNANAAALWLAISVFGCAGSRTAQDRPLLTAHSTASPSAEARAQERGGQAPVVAEVGFTVSDLPRSVAFFEEVLDFEKVAEAMGERQLETRSSSVGAKTRSAILRLGEESIELTAFQTSEGRPMPVDSRSNDLWFQHIAIVVSDMDLAYARLQEHGAVPISSAPQTIPVWNKAAGGIRAFYFRDPDGHPLEIIWYPKDKGRERWQDSKGRLFLGIDHTAIAVSETDESLRFYRDILGLNVAGESLNYGPEQEALSGVRGARVKITGLTGAKGPGVEFLEYVEPSGGRPSPRDTTAADRWYWEITVQETDLETNIARLEAAGFVVSPVDGQARVRDPDGHTIALESR